MSSGSSLLAFAGLSFALVLIPGPSVMFVVSRGVAFGRKAALVTVAGNSLGIYLQVVLVAAGLGVIVERSIAVFTAVKLLGAAYLVWLGVQAIRQRRSAALALEATKTSDTQRSFFVDGVVVGVANPKAIVFFAAILPQFVEPTGAPAGAQMLVLGMVFVVIALISDGVWGLVAGTARDWFVRSPRRLERMSVTGGLVMVGLGLRLALSGRSD
ncbi:MAG: LysE family translocator [Actinobacteria bacterium]|nr:MAG: LysE family translocator [Actinomycetota bacterium]